MANLHLNFHSERINRSVYPVAFLPDFNGWNDRPAPYPTLYFLNGYSGGALETATFTNFALFSAMYGIAIILVDGENSFYVDDERRNVLFSRFVGEELVNVTREQLPLSHKREETFIGGISMGGYGALVNGLRFKDTFGKIAMLSPALGMYPLDGVMQPGSPLNLAEMQDLLGMPEAYLGSYKDYLHVTLEALHSPAMPEIFIACGAQDPLVLDTSRTYAQLLAQSGARHVYHEEDGGHDHTFWKKALTPCCEFLCAKGEK